MPSSRQVYRDANAVWQSQTIPYLGSEIPQVGVSEWDFETYFADQIKIQHPEDHKYAGDRRGIHDQSMYNNLFGVARVGFDLMTCDIIGNNPYFVLCETIVCNYLRSIEFDVLDASGDRKDKTYEWFRNPNPQQSFWDIWISAFRDVFRYDAGAIVLTYSRGGWVREMKAYRGIEFWAELDRLFFGDHANLFGSGGGAYISNGYVSRWWQHSPMGVFIPFKPEAVVYLMMYPWSGSVYGSDIMKHFRFNYRGLMSATVAYGKIMDNGLNAGIVFKHPDIGSIEVLQQRIAGLKHVNGGPTNYGKPLHIIGHEEVETLGNNNLMNQQYIEGMKFNINIIANLFGLPSSEFSMEGGAQSRSTSYIQKDIRKSRVIGTITTLIEDKINREILPRLKGYEPGDKFSFKKVTDLDDQLKEAYVVQQNMSSLTMAFSMGIPMDIGMKLTSFGQQLSSDERDTISQMVSSQAGTMAQEGQSGRYEGDDYQETFMGYKDVAITQSQIGAVRHPEGS